MYELQYDITFTETKYICIHGQLVLTAGGIAGDYTYSFHKVTEGQNVKTARQYLERFNTYQELYSWVDNNHPEQIDNLPEEELL